MEYKKRPIEYSRRSVNSRLVEGFVQPIQIGSTRQELEINSSQLVTNQKHFKSIGLPGTVRQKLRSLSQRQAYLVLAGLVLFSVASPVLTLAMQHLSSARSAARYQLTADSKKLIGEVNKELAAKITHDSAKELYQYNKDAAKDKSDMANLGNGQQIGGGGNKYSVDLSQDSSNGVNINDTDNNLSISLIPQFKTLEGKNIEGRIVYPLHNSSAQLIYSVKGNGLKEDLIVPKEQGDNLSFKYQLKLPNTLEARLQPDGSIGIYSADPTLFGNISYGSDADQQKVEAARTKGQKTHLAFAIPAPLIKESGGKEQGRAAFELKNDVLTLKASNLKQASYPLSIDPSVVVTNASDFTKGNQEGNIEFDTTNNQIKRGALTGGSVGSWSSTTSFTTGRQRHSAVAYNQYVYILAGADGTTRYNTVQYAPINSNGTIGSWTSTSSFTTIRDLAYAVAYNGYIYILGGESASALNDVQYARINSDGSLGSWASTTSFTTARFGHTALVYGGYMYILGGCGNTGVCSSALNDVQYAAIKADGTLGSWASTTSFTTARFFHSSFAYNGYVYILGGDQGGTALSNTQYAPINSDGTLGTWNSTTSLTAARTSQRTEVVNGYVYIMGGVVSSALQNDVQYAPINANGSLGSWQTTTSFTQIRYQMQTIYANGYLYVVGGCANNDIFGNCNDFRADVQYAKIDSAGLTGSYATTTAFTTARDEHTSVAYNGYLYVLGGCSGYLVGCSTYLNDVQYAPINSDGTIGSWTATTSFATARYGHTSVAYNGYLYVIGGNNGSGFLSDVQYAPINTNGTIGSWATTTTVPTGRMDHTTVAYNNYLYILGGYDGGPLLSEVRYAPINANGTIGSWTTTSSFSGGREYHSSAVSAGYMYVIGGYTGSDQNDVQYAAINANGTVGAWSATTSMPTTRIHQASFASKGYVYVSGGVSSAAYRNDVVYAQINANGTLGSWATTASFTTIRGKHASVFYQGSIYVLGGSNSGGLLSDVQYASINNGGKGTVSSWTTNGTSFATPRQNSGVAAYNGYLYVVGGDNGAVQSDIQYAPINSNGSIGSWSTTTSLPTARSLYGNVQIYKGYLFIIGGLDGSGYISDVRSVPINANGTLGASWTTLNSFTTGRAEHTTAIYNGFLYVAGGTNGTIFGDVQYAALNNNGTIGSWSATNSMPSVRWGIASFATNGYLYILGGCTAYTILNGCQTVVGDVISAPINSNGTLGSWSTGNSMPSAIYDHRAVIGNGFVYVFGGFKAGVGQTAETVYAPIESNGTLGSWSFTSSLSTARFGQGVAYYNGYLYNVGGCSSAGAGCGGFLNDIIYSGQVAIPRVGRYSYLTDYGGDANLTKMYYRGTVSNESRLVVNYTSAPSSTAVFGSTTNINELSPNSLYTFPKTEAKNYWFNFILDDSQSATFPDINGVQFTLTDFEIYYHSATAKRLRSGKTFTTETQQSLDAGPP